MMILSKKELRKIADDDTHGGQEWAKGVLGDDTSGITMYLSVIATIISVLSLVATIVS